MTCPEIGLQCGGVFLIEKTTSHSTQQHADGYVVIP